MEVTEIKEFITQPIQNAIKALGDEVKQVAFNKILEYQTEEYNRNLFSKTILHRATPKNLYEFYQPLLINNGRYGKQRKSLPTDDIKKLLEKNKYITLIGTAGSGKSTLVKYLFLKAVEDNFKIPIKVELRYLNDFDGDIFSYIMTKVFKLNDLSESDKISDRLLKSDKFLIFFDGYDELKYESKESTTKDIDDFVKKYNKNHYVLTSRPYSGAEMIPLFHNFFIQDLDDSQIIEFIKKQIPESESEVIDKLIKAVSNEENKSYKEFIRNPLLLSMFILTFQSYAHIPQKKTLFYRQVFDTLYSHHDSMSKLAYVREKSSGLSKEEFESVLMLFCFISFFEEKFIFDIEYFNSTLSEIKTKRKSIDFESEKLIDDLQVAIGVINKEGFEFTFPHRSLQEYFAALFIANLSQENKVAFYSKIRNKIFDDDLNYYIRMDNFFMILKELDFNSFAKEIIIFNLDQIDNLISGTDFKDKFQVYAAYRKMMLIIFMLGKTKQGEGCKEKYTSKTQKGIRIGKIRKNDPYFIKLDLKEYTEYIIGFQTNIEALKQELIELINENDKGDGEILDLL